MRRVQKLPHSAGFTLFEIMVTLIIIGIVSSVAAPNVLSQIPRYRWDSATTPLSILGFSRRQ